MTQSCLKYKNNFGHLLGQFSNYSLLNAQTCIILSDTEDLLRLGPPSWKFWSKMQIWTFSPFLSWITFSPFIALH